VLYRIPGSALATLTPLTPSGQFPKVDAAGTPVAVTYPDPASWKLETDTSTPQVLRLRLTDVPGWHATLDGRPLTLHRFAGVMLETRIPPGRHSVELHYWPTDLTIGIVLAATSAAGLLCALVLVEIRARMPRRMGRAER
jgi:hypothetical protein